VTVVGLGARVVAERTEGICPLRPASAPGTTCGISPGWPLL